MLRKFAASLALLVLALPVWAQQAPVVTHHHIATPASGGAAISLNYEAAAGFMPVHHYVDGSLLGDMSYVAYSVPQAPGAPQRPIAFVWNGGPGSNTTPLHYGAFGPLRLADNRLKPNAATLLDVADLVFIDALQTGFSRVRDDFGHLNADTDTAVFAEFIANYLKDNPVRPFFLIGESYGVRRAVTVADKLRKSGLHSQGLVLISGYSLVAAAGTPAREQAMLRTPSYAAYAFDQHKLDASVGRTRAEIYASALAWSTSAYAAQRNSDGAGSPADFLATLGRFVGLDAEKLNSRLGWPETTGAAMDEIGKRLSLSVFSVTEKIDSYDFRARAGTFDTLWISHAVLDDLRLSLAFDTKRRYLGQDSPEPPPATPPPPLMVDTGDGRGPQPMKVHRATDGQDADPTLARNVANPAAHWSVEWGTHNLLPDLMRAEPQLRLMIVGGYFDEIFPCTATDVQARRDLWAYEPRVDSRCYFGGHMMYDDEAVGAQLSNDVRSFINARGAALTN